MDNLQYRNGVRALDSTTHKRTFDNLEYRNVEQQEASQVGSSSPNESAANDRKGKTVMGNILSGAGNFLGNLLSGNATQYNSQSDLYAGGYDAAAVAAAAEQARKDRARKTWTIVGISAGVALLGIIVYKAVKKK